MNADDPELAADDPRLTAYALGELPAADHAAVEAALRRDPALRAAVAEIRETADNLEAALATEALPAVRAAARGSCRGRLLEFPLAYFLIGGLAAACFAVFVVLSPRPEPRRPGATLTTMVHTATSSASVNAWEGSAPLTGELLAVAPEPTEPENPLEFTHTLAATTTELRPAVDLFPRAELTSPRLRLTFATPPPFHAPITPQVAWGNLVVPPGSFGSVAHAGPRASAPGEIVRLPTFTVRASRLAVGGPASGRALIDSREVRPPPPPGARFGRGAPLLAPVGDNDFVGTARQPVSALAIHVDTASYSQVRRILLHGTPPPREAVRIEELLNYFPFRYAPPPAGSDAPLAAALEVAEAPWTPGHRLVRIGLKARDVAVAARPVASLVFLVDVSGSMNQPNKLPLVRQALRLLVGRLRPDDRVAIVTYAGDSGVALPSTPVARAPEILHALDALTTGGSTNGGSGLRLAYDLARAHFAPNGLNRVILCTDGDFNVGTTGEAELVQLVAEQAASGINLTALGFGMGDYEDPMLEHLAGHGHGHHGYIETLREAETLLVGQVSGTLHTIAKDVKVQVEFNPAKVASHRLIGYENRLLRREDFAADRPDAGEIGAGHTLTALYEIVPAPGADQARGELLKVRVHYKRPGGFFSRKLDFPLADARTPFAQASADFRFAAAVAHYGMILRGSPHRGAATIADTLRWSAAATADSDDLGGYRAEFLDLVRRTQALVE
ncbi:MAG: von Willebrand factor type A domain-containing protein [Opitutaceae bacterium]|nr:von Willebrand factor type A domain-containing protein [Opitutaceae bacterium]